MSFDVQLAHTCPHLTLEEPTLLGADRRSLVTSQPCVLSGAVRVWANGEHQIPQGGLHSFATLHGSVSGPFNITAATGTLTINTSMATVTVTCPVGVRVTATRVVAAITAATVPSVLRATNEGGHIVLVDTARVGVAGWVRVSGTAASAVGFGVQRAVRGRQVYPGWQMHETSVEGFSVSRFPRFVSTVRNGTRFTVSYTAPRELCKRCQASAIENDYRHTADGTIAMVGDENLLQQLCLKVILTALGSNPYYTWYGSSITKRIGTKALGQVQALLREDVLNALQVAQRLQKAQAQYQQVTAKERLYAIRSVAVYPHRLDPTTFLVEADVQNASSETVNLSVVFTVPGVSASLRQQSRFLPSG